MVWGIYWGGGEKKKNLGKSFEEKKPFTGKKSQKKKKDDQNLDRGGSYSKREKVKFGERKKIG